MTAPPFRFVGGLLTGVSISDSILGPKATSCCTESEAKSGTPPSRRAKLAELETKFHCSIIGTCLSTSILRKLVSRFSDVDRARATDLDIHHEAVQLAFDAGAGAKAIHKALDDRYDATVKRLQRVKEAETLRGFWVESLASGDIPGAYWALMTHPHATNELRKLAFGDVHMLSHLVGAANRADIRRLQQLEQENTALTERLGQQQERLQEVIAEREDLSQQLAAQTLQKSISANPNGDLRVVEMAGRIELLRAELETKDQALAHHTQRRESAEAALHDHQNNLESMQAQLDKALVLVDSLQAELHAVESELAANFEPNDPEAVHHALLAMRRIVYVGGRPRSNQTIKAMVAAAGGELVVHDGGIEDRKGLLATALPRADMVVFPVDCIDHDSMSNLKRICDKHQVPFHPVRTASAASFATLVTRLSVAPTAARSGSPSRFCLKHG